MDTYAKNSKQMKGLGVYELSGAELIDFAGEIGRIASANGMSIGSCAEQIDLTECGIEHNCCIDKQLIEEIIGCKLHAGKDKNQRLECGCIESVDIGTYNTCKNDCKYCYANVGWKSVMENCRRYDVNSSLLCGGITAEDRVSKRQVKSLREEQIMLPDC